MSAFRYRWKDAVWASELDWRAKLLLLAYCEHMNAHGECRPGRPRLAAMTGLSESTVYRITRRLEGVWLELHRRPGRTTRYRALLPHEPGRAVTGVTRSSSEVGNPDQAGTAHPGQAGREPQSGSDRRTTKNPVRGPSPESSSDPGNGEGTGAGWIKNLNSHTGCRAVRGESSIGHVPDPLGRDRPPTDWPYGRPSRREIANALDSRRAPVTKDVPA